MSLKINCLFFYQSGSAKRAIFDLHRIGIVATGNKSVLIYHRDTHGGGIILMLFHASAYMTQNFPVFMNHYDFLLLPLEMTG